MLEFYNPGIAIPYLGLEYPSLRFFCDRQLVFASCAVQLVSYALSHKTLIIIVYTCTCNSIIVLTIERLYTIQLNSNNDFHY